MDDFIYDAYSIFYQLLLNFTSEQLGNTQEWAYFSCFLLAGFLILVSGILVCWTLCKFVQACINRFIRWGG